MDALVAIMIAFTLVAITTATPIGPPKNVTMAVNYLARYGYMKQSDADSLLLDAGLKLESTSADQDGMFQMALVKFQKFAGIPATGELDEATMRQMHRPRCGVKDMEDGEKYKLSGPKWNKVSLTYRTTGYTPDLPKSTVDYTFDKAFSAWQEVCGLTFDKLTSGDADIIIYFGSWGHNSPRCEPFDGKGNTLAHAIDPGDDDPLDGDVHFDEDELWTLDNPEKNGSDLYMTALHEFGHSIGLDHSPLKSAVMYAFDTGYIPDYALTSDDIEGCRALYGP